MSDNDLSDEALDVTSSGIDFDTGWHEAVRRARANPWQLLTTEQLEAFSWMLTAPETEKITDAVRAELERRKAK